MQDSQNLVSLRCYEGHPSMPFLRLNMTTPQIQKQKGGPKGKESKPKVRREPLNKMGPRDLEGGSEVFCRHRLPSPITSRSLIWG